MLRHSFIHQRPFSFRAKASTTVPNVAARTSRYISVSRLNPKNDSDDNKANNSDTNNESRQEKESEPAEKTAETTVSTEEELKAVSLKLKEMQASYLLSLADQENLRQRNTREVANAKDFAIQKFAKDLLNSIDILGMALDSVPEKFRTKDECNKQEKHDITEQLVSLYTGVAMTKTELQKTLKRYDIQLDDPIDQVFDPNKHEAVFQAPVPNKKPGTIFAVQKKGYMIKNRVLRPAQVGVVAEKQ